MLFFFDFATFIKQNQAEHSRHLAGMEWCDPRFTIFLRYVDFINFSLFAVPRPPRQNTQLPAMPGQPLGLVASTTFRFKLCVSVPSTAKVTWDLGDGAALMFRAGYRQGENTRK